MESNIKDQILEVASGLFMKYGIRRVTMDEIAKEIGISKKTIYEHFRDKDEIVNIGLQKHLAEEQKHWDHYESTSENSVEHLAYISHCLKKNFSEVNDSILFDLKKFHPSAWETFLNFKKEIIFSSVVRNLKQGIAEGYFRKEIQPEILATLRIEQIQMSFDTEVFPTGKHSMEDIQDQFFQHYVYGILTEKGLKLFNKLKNASHIKKSIAV